MTDACLEPTDFIDSDNLLVQKYADNAVGNEKDPINIASQLFYQIRDGIRYNPYSATSLQPEAFVASAITTATESWCIPKAVLFAACARYKGIPAALGFADVRNHITSEKLTTYMDDNVFIWHGYTELLLNDRWVKFSTAFNKELCHKQGTKVLDFDPVNGSLLHPFDESGNKHMDYIKEHGSFDDLPLSTILANYKQTYPGWFKEQSKLSELNSEFNNDKQVFNDEVFS